MGGENTPKSWSKSYKNVISQQRTHGKEKKLFYKRLKLSWDFFFFIYLAIHLSAAFEYKVTNSPTAGSARLFSQLATRHASHGNGGSRFELELDRRNAARGNAVSRAPRSIHGAQVGVSSDYHKTQPASN